MFLMANLQVGGDWPGMPDATTPFPAQLELDYIRVWQQP
jgi:beta-glucanase (GH16 family)